MIKPRQLKLPILVFTLGAQGLFAQPAPSEPEADSAPEATTSSEQTVAAPQATAQSSTTTTSGQDSPFEYRPSEEISEDVSVSFPVDI